VCLITPSLVAPSVKIEISWTVANQDSGEANPSWVDRVYLSSDATLDAQDRLLTEAAWNSPLASSNSYTQTRAVTLPQVGEGTYYLLLAVDAGNTLFESNETNNIVTQRIEMRAPEVVQTVLRTLDAAAGFGSLSSLDFSPDGVRLAAAAGDRALIWDLQTGELRRRYNDHSGPIDTVDFSPAGDQVLTGARDGTARIWDADTRKQFRSFPAFPGEADPAVFSSDAARVLAGSGLKLPRFWDMLTGAELTNFLGHASTVTTVALSPDNTKALTGGADKTAILWDTATATHLFTFTRHTDAVNAVAFSPDGARALTASSDGSIVVWNLSADYADHADKIQTEPIISSLSAKSVKSVDLTAGPNKLATDDTDFTDRFSLSVQSVQSVALNSVASNSPTAELVFYQGNAVSGAAFSKDGQYIVSYNGSAGVAYLWQVATRSLVRTFAQPSGQRSAMNGIAISPDRTVIATSHADSRVRLWESGLAAIPLHSIKPLALHSDAPVTLRSHSVQYFEVTAERGKNMIIKVAPGSVAADVRRLKSSTAQSAIPQTSRKAAKPQREQEISERNPTQNLSVLATSRENSSFSASSAGTISEIQNLQSAIQASLSSDVQFANLEFNREISETREPQPTADSRSLAFISGLSSAREFTPIDANKMDTSGPGGPRSYASLATRHSSLPADFPAVRVVAARGQLPSAYQSELFATAPVSTLRTEIPVANVAADKYYVLVFSPYLAKGAINVQVRAEYTDFHLSSVSPSRAGNGGALTVEIRGTSLNKNVVVNLISPTGRRIVGINPVMFSDTSIFVTFDLQNAMVGSFTLEAIRLADGAIQTIGNAIDVVAGSEPFLELMLSGPVLVRPGSLYQYRLDYRNVGDSDLAAPCLSLTSSLTNTLCGANGLPGSGYLTWLASSARWPGQVLPPGQGGTVLCYLSTRAPLSIAAGQVQAEDTPFDWATVERQFKPLGIPEAKWTNLWIAAIGKIGSTHREVLSSLRMLHKENSGPVSFNDLLRFALFVHGHQEGEPAQNRLRSQGVASLSTLAGYDPNTDVEIIPAPGTTFDPNKPTIIVTHGWNGKEYGSREQRFIDAASALATHYPDYNVVRVTWQQGSTSPIWDPRDASRNIPDVAETAVQKFTELGYSRWADTIYVGESFGNGVNAEMSRRTGSRGTGLILNAANPVGYPNGQEPDYAVSFGRSIAIQTWDFADSQSLNADITLLLRDPQCAGEECNLFGESHTSGMRYLAELLGRNPNLAKLLLEGLLQLPDQPAGLHDGGLDWAGNLYPGQYAPPTSSNAGLQITPISSTDVSVVRPVDPNDKIGPPGFGTNRVVSVEEAMFYTVRFENATNATAPVQEVVVVDYLDRSLDWTTLQFGDAAYGDRLLSLPLDVLQYTNRDFPPTNSLTITGTTEGALAVDVSATFNPQTGRVEWRLKAIDTKTGLPPADALAGILPPKADALYRNGHVSFSIKPKANAPLGTVITNRASIVFDTEEPMDTPPVWNSLGEVGTGKAGAMAYLAANASRALESAAAKVTKVRARRSLLPAPSAVRQAGAPPVSAAATTDDALSAAAKASIRGPAASVNIEEPTPSLTIHRNNNGLEVSWPVATRDYILEMTPSLAHPVVWTTVTNKPSVVNGRLTVMVDCPDARCYFRLRSR
jgi:WD40 repeat protein